MSSNSKGSNSESGTSPLTDATPWSVRFQRQRDEMTDAEQRVGAYFLQHPESVQRSISELIEISGLGYGTVIRFCQKLGCRGFQEFKVLMARDAIEANADRSKQGDPDFLQTIHERIREDLNRTARNIDRNEMERAAAALQQAGRVLCVGVASSAPLALSLEWKLKRFGIRSSFLSDGYVMAVEASLLSEGDVLVAVSSSGTTKDIVTAVQLARHAGATVIAITNFSKTPLVDASDIRLITSGARDPLAAEVPSLAEGELLLTLLAECIRRLNPEVDATVLKTFEAIADRKL